MEFSAKLRALRSQKGISQAKLAADIHISRSAVAKWENGLGLPGEESLKLLAEYFGVSVNELLPNKDNEETLVTKNRTIDRQKKVILGLAFGIGVSILIFLCLRIEALREVMFLLGFGVISVALGIFIATLGGGSFTKYNKYIIGDILSVTAGEIGMLALVLLGVVIFWLLIGNKLTLTAIHPQLASSRGCNTGLIQTLFTAAIAVVVTLAISWVGLLILNSLLVLPAASARNVSRNLKQYHLFSVVFALIAGIGGLVVSYYLGTSAGASISLGLALIFAVSFCFRKARA